MYNPVATYRIQFHKGFNFNDFEKIIPYLIKLGISTLYASPIFEATPGSTHGYDGVNPLVINPEIGSIEQLRAITDKLKAAGIGWLQDIVPNHMAYHQNNEWLMDLLEKGPLSKYKTYFDQSLADDLFSGPVMAPFLGKSLAEVIEKEQLAIAYEKQQLVFKYFEHSWPLNLSAYEIIFKGTDKQDVIQKIKIAKQVTGPDLFAEKVDGLKRALSSLAEKEAFNNLLADVNKDKDLLQTIADRQFYRLCGYQETGRTINFRRFFTVNSLICINIQREEVFHHFHQFMGQLVAEGVFQGLRIDHIDGLYNPGKYLGDLRVLTGGETYIVVEKILQQTENMPESWPVAGNTGYDFLAMVNNLFTSQSSKKRFTAFYNSLVKSSASILRQIEDKKAYILANHMAGELDNLANLFISSGLVDNEELNGIPLEMIKQAIAAFMIKCPVYRYYAEAFPLTENENGAIRRILDRVKSSNEALIPGADLLAKVWLINPNQRDEAYRARSLNFYRRVMQFTGPLMAKGVEDTLMYTYNRFIDHNEVGDSPGAFGISIAAFHRQMQLRQACWPLSLNGTSTHDTKRGEDVRARLNVLSDITSGWLKVLRQWIGMNRELKQNNLPDSNTELFIYQTLAGTYPMPGNEDDELYSSRMEEYLEKTLREGKEHSNWAAPNEPYENVVKTFTKNLLNKNRPFWKSFESFHRLVCDFGIVNSLAQVLLKFTCPGVPDVYQGCEYWDLSLVDPDNRRPVDYQLNRKLLRASTAIDGEEDLETLWKTRYNGRIKVWLTHTLLQERKRNPSHFQQAGYLPLKITGKYKDHVMAFARPLGEQWYIVALAVNIAGVCQKRGWSITEFDWMDTAIILPKKAPTVYKNLLVKKTVHYSVQIEITAIFSVIPLVILKSCASNQ